MSSDSQEPSAQHLQQLWEQGNRHIAQSFLRRVLHSEMTLLELRHALEFHKIAPHIGELRLQDVLATRPHTPAIAPNHAVRHTSAPARRVQQQRRKRRGPEELQAIREAIAQRLQSSVNGVNSTHLCMMLQKSGFEIDQLHLGRILNQLETEGAIANMGGKPRSWRLKPQGRRAPEPIVIRKGAAQGDSSTAAS